VSAELSTSVIWGVVLGMAVLNFAVRFLPMAVVSRLQLPDPVMRWLSFIPISVMGALVAGQVLRPNDQWVNPFTGASLYAAILTALVFKWTRSFLGASLAGMVSYVILSSVLPA
jgi:branched-subunit amino acid transport protein